MRRSFDETRNRILYKRKHYGKNGFFEVLQGAWYYYKRGRFHIWGTSVSRELAFVSVLCCEPEVGVFVWESCHLDRIWRLRAKWIRRRQRGSKLQGPRKVSLCGTPFLARLWSIEGWCHVECCAAQIRWVSQLSEFKMLNAFWQSKPPDVAITLVQPLRECIPEQILWGHTQAVYFCLGAQLCLFPEGPNQNKTPMGRTPGTWGKAATL